MQHVQPHQKPNEYVQHVNNYICSVYYINSLVYWVSIPTIYYLISTIQSELNARYF